MLQLFQRKKTRFALGGSVLAYLGGTMVWGGMDGWKKGKAAFLWLADEEQLVPYPSKRGPTEQFGWYLARGMCLVGGSMCCIGWLGMGIVSGPVMFPSICCAHRRSNSSREKDEIAKLREAVKKMGVISRAMDDDHDKIFSDVHAQMREMMAERRRLDAEILAKDRERK